MISKIRFTKEAIIILAMSFFSDANAALARFN